MVWLGKHTCRVNGTTDNRECDPRRDNGKSHRSIKRLGDFARRSLGKRQQLLCEARASTHASCGRRAAIGANKAEQIFKQIIRRNPLSIRKYVMAQRRVFPRAPQLKEIEVPHEDVHPVSARRLPEAGE